MAQNYPAQDSPAETAAKIKHYIDTKRYIDEPEILPWYKKELDEIKPRTRELLEKYSKIPSAEVEEHVKRVRKEAFKIFPYPCVGNWGFLNLSIAESRAYPDVLERIKQGDRYLDMGCCMGADVRKLVYDGAPSEHLVGTDLKGDFFDIGYDLFLDKAALKTKFIQADVLDVESGLNELDGQISIVHAGSFFHLFNWDNQVQAAKRVVQLLKAEPNAIIFGRQGARVEAGSFGHISKEHTAYWHNPESWAKMWEQIGDETGSRWVVESSLGEEDLSKRMNTNLVPVGSRFMTFTIRRV